MMFLVNPTRLIRSDESPPLAPHKKRAGYTTVQTANQIPYHL